MINENNMDLRNEAKVSSLGRLFQLLTNIFGQKKQMRALEKIEGKEVLAVFPSLGDRFVTWKVSNCHILPYMNKSDRAVAQIIFNVPRDAIVPLIVDVIRTKASIPGLFKLMFKYLVPGKIKLKGSILIAVKIIMALMIGAHPMYVEEKRLHGEKIMDGGA